MDLESILTDRSAIRLDLINANVLDDVSPFANSLLGDERAEGLTFSPLLLPSDIPNNIFHVPGDGFQLHSVVSIPRDHQPPATTLILRRHTREFLALFVRSWEYHGTHVSARPLDRGRARESLRCDECFSARLYPVLLSLRDTDILGEKSEGIAQRGAARTD